MGRTGLIFSLLLAIAASAALAAPATQPSAKDIFSPSTPHTIHLKLSSAAWDAIQPGAAAGKIAVNATREQARAAGVRLTTHAGSYASVLCEIEFDGCKIADAGLRFKGNSSYAVSAGSQRRPMKIDFDRFVENGRFAGLETLNLSNTTYDPSQVRESLAFWLYRKLDVPAPRTGFALVYLTVAGKFEREYLGLYTLIEEVNHQLLKKHFGNEDGLLVKPSGARGLAYFGEKWEDYAGFCSPRTEVKPQHGQKIAELAKLTHRADDATFAAKVESLLAVDEFLRYVAVTSAVISFDSFLSTGHNYYMYVNPKDELIYFIPWDLNMCFGGYGWVGTIDELARTDIHRAYADHNILIERVLKIPKYAAAYRGHMHRLSGEWLAASHLAERRQTVQGVLDAADKASRDAKRVGNPTTQPALGTWPLAPDLWPFVEMRGEWIRLQLEGHAIGFKADFRNPKRTLDQWAGHTVAAVAFMDAVDADGDRRMNDAEVKGAIARLFAAANLPQESVLDAVMLVATLDGLMGDDLKKRVPAKAWADWIMAIADANKDGRVSAPELLAVFQRFQPSGDTDRDGMMDGRELVEQMGVANAPRDPDPLR